MTNRRGFSLTELLLVIAILLMMSGMTAAFYSRFLVQNAMENTVSQIVEDLRKAQMYSMSGKMDSSWGVRYVDSKIQLYAVEAVRTENFDVNPNVSVSGLNGIVFAKGSGTVTSDVEIRVNSLQKTKIIRVNQLGVVER